MSDCDFLFVIALGLGISEEFEDESITWTPSVSNNNSHVLHHASKDCIYGSLTFLTFTETGDRENSF